MSVQDQFWIGFTIDVDRVTEGLVDVSYGRIVVNELREGFVAPTTFWGERDYERQWFEGLARIADGEANSCLLTSVADPKDSAGVMWWLLYIDGQHVYLQNGILVFNEMDIDDFDPDQPYNQVRLRTQINEDGHRVSQWNVSLAAISQCLAQWTRPLRD